MLKEEKDFSLKINSSNEEILERCNEVLEYLKGKPLHYWTFYEFISIKFKKSYSGEELLTLIKEHTGLTVYFCNGVKDFTEEVVLGYEGYQGVLSLMAEDRHESFYNPPADFEEEIYLHKEQILTIWNFLKTLA